MDTVVKPDGTVHNGSFSEMGGKGWGPCNLTNDDLQSLKQAIDALPPSAPLPVPVLRRILVHGMRSNSWFAATYDRADVPAALERACELSCASVGWIVGTAKSTAEAKMHDGHGWLNGVTVAASAPVAVSTTARGVQLWDLDRWEGTPVSTTNRLDNSWSVTALSPDGKLLIVSGWDTVVALEFPALTTRWVRRNPVKNQGRGWCFHLAAFDGGNSLALALPNGIQRWSLADGEPRGTLGTNDFGIHGKLKSSRDGSLLAADVEKGSVLVWQPGWTNAPLEIGDRISSRLLDVSPDGRFVALYGRGQRGARLVLCDLKSATRSEVPFRGCWDSRSIHTGAWSPDGKFFGVASTGGWPCVLDTATWKPVVRWRVPGETQYWSGGALGFLAFSSDGTLLARYDDGTLRGLKLPLAAESIVLPDSDDE